MFVGRIVIVDCVAVAYQEFVSAVHHPLQSIAEKFVGIFKIYGLHKFGAFEAGEKALHEAHILHSIEWLSVTLACVHYGIAVAGLEALSAEAKHIAMIHRIGAPYTELIYLL